MRKKKKPNWEITCATCEKSFYTYSKKNPAEVYDMRCPFCRVAIHKINAKKINEEVI